MANVLGAIVSILSGIGNVDEDYQRIQDALSQDPNRVYFYVVSWIEKDFTKNEHLYSRVIASLRCNRIRYAINTLEAILMNDPTDVLAIHILSYLYPMIGDSQGMVHLIIVFVMQYGSISRTWSYWGIAVACDNLMPGYRAQTLLDLGFYE